MGHLFAILSCDHYTSTLRVTVEAIWGFLRGAIFRGHLRSRNIAPEFTFQSAQQPYNKLTVSSLLLEFSGRINMRIGLTIIVQIHSTAARPCLRETVHQQTVKSCDM